MNKVRQAVECLKGNLFGGVINAGIDPTIVKSLRFKDAGYFLSAYSEDELPSSQGGQTYICTIEEFNLEALYWWKDKSFSKSQLKNGEHVVELNNGQRYLTLGDYMVSTSGYSWLNTFEDDLTIHTNGTMVTKVYSIKKPEGLVLGWGFSNINGDNLTLVWERPSL